MALDGIVVSNIVAGAECKSCPAPASPKSPTGGDEVHPHLKKPEFRSGPAAALSKRKPSADLFHFGQ